MSYTQTVIRKKLLVAEDQNPTRRTSIVSRLNNQIWSSQHVSSFEVLLA